MKGTRDVPCHLVFDMQEVLGCLTLPVHPYTNACNGGGNWRGQCFDDLICRVFVTKMTNDSFFYWWMGGHDWGCGSQLERRLWPMLSFLSFGSLICGNEFMNGRQPLDGLSPCLLWGLDHQSSDLFNSFTIQAKSIAKGLGPQLVYRGWSVSPTVALATSTPGSHVTIESMSLARWGGV